ncbi:MAG: DUF3352 domain-containing protein [Elusimicrobia bacterium]|jgi:hypothetical protein|nr:DUF3352 domain-containing protein [Elusimicrobiota bacterium]
MFIMMKQSTKRALIIIGAVAVVGVVAWGLRYNFSMPALRGDTLLTYVPHKSPGGSLAGVAGINRLADKYYEIKKTQFYKSFRAGELYNLLKDNASFEGVMNSGQINLNVRDELDTQKVMDIIGDKFIVALYRAKPEPEYIIISKIDDKSGVKSVLYNALKNSELTVDNYKGTGIDAYSRSGYYSLYKGYLVAGNSIGLIKKTMELIAGEESVTNFNSVYPQIEDSMDANADGYIFTVNKELKNIIEKYTDNQWQSPKLKTTKGLYTYQEFYNRDGIYIKSRGYFAEKENDKNSPQKSTPKTGESESLTINLIPGRPLVAGALNNTGSSLKDYDRLGGKETVGRELYDRIDKGIINNIDGEAGYAILGPENEDIKSILPRLVIYLKVKNRAAAEKISGHVEDILGVEMKDKKYKDNSYKTASIPLLFGQKIKVSICSLKYKGNVYFIIASPFDVLEKVIDISRGELKSLKESPEWREISKFLPKKYNGYSYADVNAVSNTVGVFIAKLRGKKELENFLKTAPFSWIGPSASVGSADDDSTIVHTYIPMQDLSRENWDKIFESVIPIID